jgi:hypothetical protein
MSIIEGVTAPMIPIIALLSGAATYCWDVGSFDEIRYA